MKGQHGEEKSGRKSKRGRQGNCGKIPYMDASSSRRGKHKLVDGWQFAVMELDWRGLVAAFKSTPADVILGGAPGALLDIQLSV